MGIPPAQGPGENVSASATVETDNSQLPCEIRLLVVFIKLNGKYNYHDSLLVHLALVS